jgi:hypothetical protein
MKTFSKLAATAVIAILALAGCSAGDESKSDTTVSAKAEIVKTVDDFYAKSIEQAPAALKTFESGPEEMAKLISAADLKILGESSDPFTGLKTISPEAQKKVADFYKGLDPVTEFYDYEGLDDAEQAGVSLTSLITTTFLTSNDVAEAARKVDESNITIVDDTHATSNFRPGVDPSSSNSQMFLIKTDKGWKIDGKKTYDQYYADMKSDPTPSAEPTPSASATPSAQVSPSAEPKK